MSEARQQGYPLWLVTDFGPAGDAHEVNAFWVRALTAEEAAERAVAFFEAEHDYGDRLNTVTVVDAEERVFYEIGPRATIAPLQCCGGADSSDGHSGFCQLHNAGTTVAP